VPVLGLHILICARSIYLMNRILVRPGSGCVLGSGRVDTLQLDDREEAAVTGSPREQLSFDTRWSVDEVEHPLEKRHQPSPSHPFDWHEGADLDLCRDDLPGRSDVQELIVGVDGCIPGSELHDLFFALGLETGAVAHVEVADPCIHRGFMYLVDQPDIRHRLGSELRRARHRKLVPADRNESTMTFSGGRQLDGEPSTVDQRSHLLGRERHA